MTSIISTCKEPKILYIDRRAIYNYYMKIICISDTHGLHRQLKLPPGDILIHSGDLSHQGRKHEIRDFLSWLADQPYRHKVFIGGNHDFYLEQSSLTFHKMIPEGCTYLENSEAVIEGIRFWGSPVTPYYYNWAFNRHRGKEIGHYWDKIPDGIDILITHGPPAMTLDRTFDNRYAGCEVLRERILELRPAFHLFGHIHEGYGKKMLGYTQCVNASVLNIFHKPVNIPQELSIEAMLRREKNTRQPAEMPGILTNRYLNSDTVF